jgi:iron complex outermembrane receptor protein
MPSTTLRRTRPIPWAACALFVAWPASVGGQEETSSAGEDLTALSIEALMEIEVATVWGASKMEERVTDAPAAVTIVTAEDIRRHGWETLAELLRSVRGFYTSDDRNYVRIGLRGFGPPGDYNSRILLLIDGHRVNDDVYDQATVGREFLLDLDLVERVEIVRGPGSSLFGSNAFFGVVNVIPRRGPAWGGIEVETSLGSFGAYGARATWGGSLRDGLEATLSGSLFDSRGDELFYEEYLASPSVGQTDGTDDEESGSLFASLRASGWTLQGAFVRREKGIPTGSFGTVFDDPRNETVDSAAYLDLSSERPLGPERSLRQRYYASWFDYRGEYVYDDGAGSTYLNHDRGAGTWLGLEVSLNDRTLAGHVLTVGSEVRVNLEQEQRNFDAFGDYLDDQRDSVIFGLFAQDEIVLAERWRLSAGLRFDHYDGFGGTLNPRLGLIHQPRQRTALKLLVGRAFRAPNAYELYYQDGSTANSNPDLEPETIQSVEGVWEEYWRAGLRTSASAFHYEIEDLILQEVEPLDGLLIFRNRGRVMCDGVELEAEATLGRGWKGIGSYAWQDARDADTGDELSNSPQHVAQLRVDGPLWSEAWLAGLDARFVSDRLDVLGDEVEDGFVLDATLVGRLAERGLELSLGVTNLLDSAVHDPAGPEHVQDEILQDGRALRARLRWRP